MKVSNIIYEGFISKYLKYSINEDWREDDMKRKAKIFQDDKEKSEERRRLKVWEPDGVDYRDWSSEADYANALLKYFIVYDPNITVISDEDISRIKELEQKIEELKKQFDDSEDVEYDLLSTIEVYEDEIEEIKDGKIDLYGLIPDDLYYDELQTFHIIGDPDEVWAIGTEDEFEEALDAYMRDVIDESGLKNLNVDFEQFIDYRDWKSFLFDYYWDMMSDDPEDWLGDSFRELSDEQVREVEYYNLRIRAAQRFFDKTNDRKYLEEIDDIQDEIKKINDNPEGDYNYTDEDIENMVNERVSDYEDDFDGFIDDTGWDREDMIDRFVDKDEVIKHVIDTDGKELIATCDGEVNEVLYNDKWYYIVKARC